MKNIFLVILSLFILTSVSAQQQYFIKTFGGANEDYFSDVETTPDGGYIMVGASKSYGPDPDSYDGYIVITDSLGNKIKGVGYNGGGEEEAAFVRRSPDNTYYICFNSEISTDVYRTHLLNVNDTLGLIWDSPLFVTTNAWFNDGCFMPDGKFVVTGRLLDSVSMAIWFDNQGDTIFTKTMSNNDSNYYSRIAYRNNKLVLDGYKVLTSVFNTECDANGNILNNYEYRTTLGNPNSMINDDSILYCVSMFNTYSIIHAAVDTSNDSLLWQNTLYPPEYFLNASNMSLYNNDLMICGNAYNKIDTMKAFLVMISEQNGEVIWERFYKYGNNQSTYLFNVKQIGNRIIGVGHTSQGNIIDRDAFLLVADENGYAGINDYHHESLIAGIYPNPVKDILTVELHGQGSVDYRVFDMFGRLVLSGTSDNNQISVSKLSVGLYILHLLQDGGSWRAKFMKN